MKTKLSFLLFALIATTLSAASFADELMLSLEDAALQGYTPYQAQPSLFRAQPYLNQPLKWPFEKPYSKSRMGNNFVQFQPYEMPGYHMGDDMLLESNSWALAPIDGKLEAGHYAYTDLPNGNRIKQWIAWPGRGDDNYFEIAVIDGNGNRYELHHVNRRTLPQNIIDGLNSGNGTVMAGERIGQVVPWPTMFHYVHVHLNIFDSAGTAINPESVFEVIPDSIAPDVSFLAIYQDDSTEWLKEGSKLSKPVKSFIVSGADAKDLHQYVQAVPFIELTQNGVVLAQLDFRYTLLDTAGIFTDIRGFYPNTVRLSDKTLLRQPTDFYPVAGTKFHQLLNVSGAVAGQPFQLKVQDMAGNATVLSGQF